MLSECIHEGEGQEMDRRGKERVVFLWPYLNTAQTQSSHVAHLFIQEFY
jgi:hypothetical protein